jgi:hypothetical protein
LKGIPGVGALAFSKKLENFEAAVGLHFVWDEYLIGEFDVKYGFIVKGSYWRNP